MFDLFEGCQGLLARLDLSELLYGRTCQLVLGTRMTVVASLLAMLVAILLGLIAATAKVSSVRLLRQLAEAYTIIIRGVPELVMLTLVYFGGTRILRNIVELLGYGGRVEINAFVTGVATIGFIYGAYATEVFRGAILAVPKGQLEAAKACGMSRWLVIRRILLPQVWRFAIPGLGNVWLVLLKATALMSVVGLDELTRKGFIAAGATFKHFTFFAVVAIVYLLLTTASYPVIQWAERAANRGVRRA
jgi:His/Glu/Gln/Arg/opine family amino acid ABC transporter permease subunit